MRISYLAATALAVYFLPFSTTAFAGCSSSSCATAGNAITYGSGSYSASSAASNYSSSSHVSQGISTRFGVASTAVCPSGATRARDGYCMSSGSSSSVGVARSASLASGSAYGSSHRSSFRSAGQVVPFTTTISKISKYRVPGMARNEFLSPTTCPTNVYNPEGAKVLGCYSVVKPVQVVRPMPQIRYQQVRVVRPIIYVRYPVPTHIPVPVCRSQTVCGSGCSSTTYSRYSNAWPRYRNNCSGW